MKFSGLALDKISEWRLFNDELDSGVHIREIPQASPNLDMKSLSIVRLCLNLNKIVELIGGIERRKEF